MEEYRELCGSAAADEFLVLLGRIKENPTNKSPVNADVGTGEVFEAVLLAEKDEVCK